MDILLKSDWIVDVRTIESRRPPLVSLYFPLSSEGSKLFNDLSESMNRPRQNFSLCFPDATVQTAGIVTSLSAPDRNGYISALIQTTARGD